jgi:hypothetical protein
MVKLPLLPVIFICSGCFLAIIIGTAFRVPLLLLGFSRAGLLPNGLSRWLYGMNYANKPDQSTN